MKTVFAQYEHSCIGFPGVVLKWHEENGKWGLGYIVVNKEIFTVNGRMYNWCWSQPHPEPFAQHEMELFDKWVRSIYSNNLSVQG